MGLKNLSENKQFSPPQVTGVRFRVSGFGCQEIGHSNKQNANG
jgi:hypothetical protein